MDQSSVSVSKTRHIRPLTYSHLVTSTPAFYQVAKRIKRIIGYSEHYKGKNSSQGLSSLRSRDYRKARELNLELWSPAKKSDFLEKFLKTQKNVHKIQIRIIKENFSKELLEQFLKVLCKMSRLKRLHIDFEKGQSNQQASFFIHQIKYLKSFPKLKDWTVTVDGEELFPFSASLFNLGFYCENSSIVSKTEPVIEQLMKKTPKFHQLDTLRVDSRKLGSLPNKFLDRLAFVISKLPDFKELNLNYSRDLFLSPKPALNIFDKLLKAQRFEILKIGTQMKEASQISILKHPLFQTQSLKRTHLSLFFTKGISPENFNQTLDLLQEIPSLYGLYLDFSLYPNINDKIAEALMEKLNGLTRLRKLKIVFDYYAKELREKQTGRIIRWVFNSMPFLEELCLDLPRNSLDFGERIGEDIQGLPKLRRVLISLKESDEKMEKHVFGLIGILGKCQRLRELEMDLTGCVYDNLGMTKKFGETLVKLKGLQVFKLHSRSKEISVYLLKNVFAIFDKMRDLQDWSFGLMVNIKNSEERDWLQTAFSQMRREGKYRFFDLGSSLAHSWRPF